MNKDAQVFSLTYANRIRRCDEAIRLLTGVIEAEANRIHLPMKIPNNLYNLRAAMQSQSRLRNKSSQAIFEILEEDISKYSKLIIDQKIQEEEMHNLCLTLIGKQY